MDPPAVAGSEEQDPAYGVGSLSSLLPSALLILLAPLLHLRLPFRTKLRRLRLLLRRQHGPDVRVDSRFLDRHLDLRLRHVLRGRRDERLVYRNCLDGLTLFRGQIAEAT